MSTLIALILMQIIKNLCAGLCCICGFILPKTHAIPVVLYFDVLERLRHHNSSMLDSKIEIEFISLSFLLDGKVPKYQGVITMLAFLSQRYLLAIQGMKKHNKS